MDVNSKAAVLVHGFTGTNKSMEPLAATLRAGGWHVETPTLPGHGTQWRDLGKVLWHEWCDALDEAIDTAKSKSGSSSVVLGGLSMGGALVLRAAAIRLDVERIVLVNPSLGLRHPLLPFVPLLKWVWKSIPNDGRPLKDPSVLYERYPRIPLAAIQQLAELCRDVDQRLGAVHAPLLIFRSLADGASGEWSAQKVLQRTQSVVRSERLLHLSGHVATLDYDSDLIAVEAFEFLGNPVA
jgi:carboxylesterase